MAGRDRPRRVHTRDGFFTPLPTHALDLPVLTNLVLHLGERSMIYRKPSSDHTPPPRLLGRSALAVYSLLLAYGGGLWLHLLHEAEGATEQNAPHTIIHWLRDSTLALPMIVFGVFLATHLARRLLARYGSDASRLTTSALIATVVSLYAAVIVAVGNPVHAALLGGEHGGHDLPGGAR